MSEYTVLRASDAPDYTADAPGAFIGYGRPMGAQQLALNLRVLEPGMAHVPPGGDESWGHAHTAIEEIYSVLDGEVTIKLGDDVLPLGVRDAVLIPPATTRAMRNDSAAQATVLMCSVKVEDPMSEFEAREQFWPNEAS